MDPLSYLMSGDLFGFADAVYSGLVGELWLLIPLLILFVPLYIKTESLEFCGILWMLLGGLLIGFLPARATAVGTVLLVLGIAAVLYRLVSRLL